MRIFLSLVLVIFFSTLHAQTMVCYNYDAAGNRIQKNNCASFTGNDPGKGDSGKESIIDRSFSTNSVPLITRIEGEIVPNPNNGVFELRLESVPQEDAWYELYDAHGQFLFRQKLEGTVALFDLSDMAPGAYFLFIRSSSLQNRSWSIVKQ
jgi:hypothetical protein